MGYSTSILDPFVLYMHMYICIAIVCVYIYVILRLIVLDRGCLVVQILSGPSGLLFARDTVDK